MAEEGGAWGATFVVITHLAPSHESMTAEILQRSFSIPVVEIQGDTEVEPDHVHVIPPNSYLSLKQNSLELSHGGMVMAQSPENAQHGRIGRLLETEIEIDSELGRGSKFSFRLPMGDLQEAKESTTDFEGTDVVEAGASGGLVLVVDDDVSVLDATR